MLSVNAMPDQLQAMREQQVKAPSPAHVVITTFLSVIVGQILLSAFLSLFFDFNFTATLKGTSMPTLIRPTNDQVILKPLKQEDRKTSGGIVLPDTTRDSCALGLVFAVGRGLPVLGTTSAFHKPEVERHDEVIYYKNRTTPVNCEGENFLLIKAEDILAVISRYSDPPTPADPAPTVQ
jgi:chaperonin GroES